MGRELNEYEQEAYGNTETVIEEIAPVVEEAPPVVEEPVIEEITPVVEVPPVTEPAPVAETPAPYKSKKFIEVEDEKALYAKLNAKYRHENMKPEEKAMNFLAEQNPELDDKDLLFLAATQYNIGVDAVDESELTDAQKIDLKTQEINKKRLIKQADDHFKSVAEKVALEDYDPLDLDPEYKEYRNTSQKQKADALAEKERLDNILTSFETNSKAISEIKDSIEIDLDESKFAVPVTFKLNEERQKQLADYAKRYTPTQEEYNTFNDPETGKFDYKGYLQSLAPIVFAKDMAKAGMRQALAKDREQFMEKELKNSTLRNNDISQTTEPVLEAWESWPFGK